MLCGMWNGCRQIGTSRHNHWRGLLHSIGFPKWFRHIRIGGQKWMATTKIYIEHISIPNRKKAFAECHLIGKWIGSDQRAHTNENALILGGVYKHLKKKSFGLCFSSFAYLSSWVEANLNSRSYLFFSLSFSEHFTGHHSVIARLFKLFSFAFKWEKNPYR